MILYKYLNESRISILEDGLIRFTQPQAFNDPFELKPLISSLAGDTAIIDELNDQFKEIIKNEYEKLPSSIKDNFTFQKFLEFSYSKKEDVISNLLTISKEIMPLVNEEMHKAFEDSIGILSLTENDNNLLMWAHYANSHQGYVIGFDSTHKFFNQKKSKHDALRSLKKISYSKLRPKMELINIDGIDSFIIKSKEWAYEKEWRMLHSLHDSYTMSKDNPYDIYLFKIPFSAINSISIGARATEKTIDKIKKILISNNELKHISLHKYSIHKSEFKIVKSQIKDFGSINA